jgi:uncharacterized membrane protein HdeD (DUF308 family)
MLFGLYEISVGVVLRRRVEAWWLVIVHGVASLLFGALTMGVTGLSIKLSLAVACGWLLLYAGVAWSGAILVWPMKHVRWTLLLWGGVNVALAVISALYPEGTIFVLLYSGAAYAALFGAWQVVAGAWLRHKMHIGGRHHRGALAHAAT